MPPDFSPREMYMYLRYVTRWIKIVDKCGPSCSLSAIMRSRTVMGRG